MSESMAGTTAKAQACRWSEEAHIMVAEVAAATSGIMPISSIRGPCTGQAVVSDTRTEH